jgi:hypothetical protein
MRLMLLHPEADAICPMQSARGWNSVLATSICRTERRRVASRANCSSGFAEAEDRSFRPDDDPRVVAQEYPKPWFLGVPAKDGSWGEGHVDEDIYFWRQWALSGKTLFAANRVAVGHIEPMIKWPVAISA